MPLLRSLRSWIALALMLLASSAQAAGGDDPKGARRVALVIGNGAYTRAPALPNPARDAAAVASTLRGLGFDVIEGTDLDQSGMRARLADFAGRLEGADASLLFYAGHGMQVEGRNYLLPTDAVLGRQVDLYLQTVNLDDVLRLMEASTPTRLVILDACRDNPFAGALSRSMGTRGGAVGQGLAKLDAGVGTLIAYATAPDQVALDGKGEHSPFTAALLRYLATPGLEARQVMSRVRSNVIEATRGRQVPWDTSSLTGDFYFTLNLTVTVAPPAAPSPLPDGAVELAMWQSAERIGTGAAYRSYADRYCPKGTFCGLADEALRKLAAPAPATPQPPLPAVAALPPPEQAAEPPRAPPPVDERPAAAEADLLATLPRSDVRAVQEALAALGLDPGEPDGRPGTRTHAALAAWQRARGGAETGTLTEEARRALLAEAAPRLAAARDAPDPPPAPRPPGSAGRAFRDGPGLPLMVTVPAGRFVMGSPAGSAEADPNETPAVEVAIARPFAIGVHEVTGAEWAACVRDGGCRDFAAGANSGGDLPVMGATWRDAAGFAAWLARRTGEPYALPSEAEWEYAARAGTAGPYPWGATIGRGNAACDGCGTAFDYERPAPVGSFRPNAFGLFDTAGNVWEWTRDCWRDDHASAPRDGRAVGEGGSCDRRVVKGGSYASRPQRLRSAAREAAFAASTSPGRGFRVVRRSD